VIEHPVNDDSRDGNVEPHGQRPARDAFVQLKTPAQRAIKGHEHQRDDRGREYGMRTEQREIEAAHRALSREARHAVMRVVPEVANQKKG